MTHRKYIPVNDSYFENIDSQDKAYLLGIVITDGWITKHGIELSMCDLDVIEYFKSKLGLSNPIRIRQQRVNHNIMHTITVSSKKMKEDLRRFNCIERKTFIVGYPLIDKYLEHHFVRGLMDGDGSVWMANTSIESSFVSASKSLINGFTNYLNSIGCVYKERYNNTTTEIRISTNSSTTLFNSIYEGAEFSMKRKHDVFMKFLNRRK